MKKGIRYMGVTAAVLLAVAPVMNVNAESSTENTVKAEEAKSTNGYSVTNLVCNQDGSYSVSGTFPAKKDGKQIEIKFENVKFNPIMFDNKKDYEEVKLQLPAIEGYTIGDGKSVDYSIELMGLKYDAQGKVIGFVTLSNEPVYNKTGEASETDDGNYVATQIIDRIPNDGGYDPKHYVYIDGGITENEDGSYTFNGSIPATKDGKKIEIPVKGANHLSNIDSYTFTLPTYEGYTLKYPEATIALRYYNYNGVTLVSAPIVYTKINTPTTNHNHHTNAGSNTSSTNKTPTTDVTENNDNKPTNISNVTKVYSPSVQALLYNSEGKVISNRALAKGTVWAVNQTMTLNGETYYRVATDEWVKKDDGLEVIPNKGTVTTSSEAILYNSKGIKITNRALAKNTVWFTDRSATINGQKMYRVATDEWVAASDIQ
ncbi:SLAP domain-containing protein [Companilactobacillus sp. FL22-1]|uniref:SLAP domain-containing protein n=1 Tax=Companilactobacillus sp. FL22-1 TaxID=3373892 RepID=UPI003753F65F